VYVKKIGITLFLLLSACQPATPSSTVIPSVSCPNGEHTQEISSGGQVRQYILHVPAAYQPDTPTALVLGFHGAGSSTREFESYSDFSFMANLEEFIVAYPQALGEHPTWNTARGAGNPDLQFVQDVLAEIQARCNIDNQRIYATGHSNGGGMANRLACDLSEWIAAIGTVAGAYQGSEGCSPTRPVPVLGIHGTEDLIVPYNGYDEKREPPAAYFVISIPIPQWAAAWAVRNGCDPQPVTTDPNEKVTQDHWSNCRADADVVLYTIRGGGHEWPEAFEAAQVIWEFFAGHPL
jgi:polyhydroxybutyrate depolymerase